jgi:hypothetical protein
MNIFVLQSIEGGKIGQLGPMPFHHCRVSQSCSISLSAMGQVFFSTAFLYAKMKSIHKCYFRHQLQTVSTEASLIVKDEP